MGISPLNKSVQYIKYVGPEKAKALSIVGINTIQDLLFFFPSRYLDRRNQLTVSKLVEYLVNGYDGEVTVVAKVEKSEHIRYRKKQIFKVHFRDPSGFFEAVWFNGFKYLKGKFSEGEHYVISGKPNLTKYGNLQFAHPDYDKFDENETKEYLNTGGIIPFYKTSAMKGKLGDYGLRKIIKYALDKYSGFLEETLPREIIELNNLSGIKETISNLHFPVSNELLQKAFERMKFEELFFFQLLLGLRKKKYKSLPKNRKLNINKGLINKFINSLNFELTEAQLKVLSEIRNDLESDKPMNRLLQGDVGSGKTIVSLISMLMVVSSGYQAAIMAPTEILANQHFYNISKLVEPLGIRVGILIGSKRKKEKEATLEALSKGEIDIVIGTHALLEDGINFKNLALAVIDEQHRFGVEQRMKLINKGNAVDVLIMTATPIPRTLTMSFYGDLDVSVIDSLPKNRLPVKTVVRPENKLPDIYKFINDKCNEGNQAIIVFPLVEESEKSDLKSAEKYFDELNNTYLKNRKVALIHGQMNWSDKDLIMKDFAAKKYEIIIATTVIEVGIDIKDANIILINDAHQFGLSQLHQLRGRVGRGGGKGYCILVSDKIKNVDLSVLDFEFLSKKELEENKAAIRLSSMEQYSSGFDLSEIDMKLRGPGNILGKEQSGLPSFKYADIIKDREILINAKNSAFAIVEEDPNLNKENNLILKEKLVKDFNDELKFIEIG